MNKGISLAIVAVLLCAMGIIFFMNINAGNKETDLASAPLEEIRPTTPADTPTETAGALPLVGEQTTGQTQSPDSPKTSTTPVAVPPKTESVKPVQEKKPTPEAKPAETKPTPTPPAQSTPPAVTADQEKTPSLKPLEAPVQKPTPPAGQASADGHSLSKIGLHFKGNDIYLRIEANGPFKTKIFALTEPDRLVVDLVGKWNNVTPPTIPSNQLVTKVRIGNQPNATRLVLDLSRGIKYTIEKPSDSVVEVLMQ